MRIAMLTESARRPAQRAQRSGALPRPFAWLLLGRPQAHR
ncbi:hypothetical protein FHR34_002688 [Kitasatospora kifunensis]|uniref:Uncharacterized protein n=1 Tax=Kitasatospora kifunensis TaxID=58351 RepID=A0A7W7R1K0_KITKI|nr:hypothetical protein [Kitasatospora kifunensis]